MYPACRNVSIAQKEGGDVYKSYDLFSNPDTLFAMSCEMLCNKILK